MRHLPLIGLLLFSPGLAAQELRSGPSARSINSQLPPASPRAPDANQPQAAPGDRDARTGADEARTAPPPDHRVLGGPPVPGARQPQASEGFTTNRDVIPPNIGERIRPEASTTGR